MSLVPEGADPLCYWELRPGTVVRMAGRIAPGGRALGVDGQALSSSEPEKSASDCSSDGEWSGVDELEV